ncbi:MAG: hypothetical protein QG608_2191, partial [Actinomycetota bacterium]|nr:hypothetical protein [Actinomycetota bacterium]
EKAAEDAVDVDTAFGSRDPNTLLTRFLVLASTLIENWPPLLSRPGKGPKKGNKWGLLESTMRDPGSPARGHAAVLVTLRTARNKVHITHDHKNGAVTAVEAAVDVLKNDLKDGFKSLGEPWPESPSPISLLQAAPAAARPWDLPADGDTTLHDRYCCLRERLVAACDDAAGRERR